MLPGLVIVGWWQGFPYWMTMTATGLGGILGVMFSVPLRRALVVNSDLPYPEGVAAAEVLLVGEQSRDGNEGKPRGDSSPLRSTRSHRPLFFALSQTRLLVDEAAVYFRVGAGVSGVSASLSLALGRCRTPGGHFGRHGHAGRHPHCVVHLGADPDRHVGDGRVGAAHCSRGIFAAIFDFFGAGVIGIAALWTFSRILGPIIAGLRSAMAASSARAIHGHAVPLVERDLPIKIVGGVVAVALALIALLLWQFIAGSVLAEHAPRPHHRHGGVRIRGPEW